MHRVLVAGKLHDSGLAVLRGADGIELNYIEEISTASMEPHLASAEALLLRTQPMDAAAIARSPKLRIVSRHGVGYDAVDVAALNARRIPLAIVGGVNAITVAEHAMLLLLSASRRLLAYDAATRPGGDWNYRNSLEAREISGKTLLIIGLGRIGRLLARMAAGFDITVTAYDPYAAAPPPAGVTMVSDARMGGGSVSTALFSGQSITDLVIDGKQAWATRVASGDVVDDVGFVRQRSGWKIRLFARRPRG